MSQFELSVCSVCSVELSVCNHPSESESLVKYEHISVENTLRS